MESIEENQSIGWFIKNVTQVIKITFICIRCRKLDWMMSSLIYNYTVQENQISSSKISLSINFLCLEYQLRNECTSWFSVEPLGFLLHYKWMKQPIVAARSPARQNTTITCSAGDGVLLAQRRLHSGHSITGFEPRQQTRSSVSRR